MTTGNFYCTSENLHYWPTLEQNRTDADGEAWEINTATDICCFVPFLTDAHINVEVENSTVTTSDRFIRQSDEDTNFKLWTTHLSFQGIYIN